MISVMSRTSSFIMDLKGNNIFSRDSCKEIFRNCRSMMMTKQTLSIKSMRETMNIRNSISTSYLLSAIRLYYDICQLISFNSRQNYSRNISKTIDKLLRALRQIMVPQPEDADIGLKVRILDIEHFDDGAWKRRHD